MGKLKTSLTSLATLADAIAIKGDKAIGELQARATSVSQIGGRVAGGYELLYMYLKQKALGGNAKIEAWSKDPLQAHMDAKVNELIKGIQQACAELGGAFKVYDESCELLAKMVLTDLGRALEFAREIDGMIAKKKKKLLQSSKFKGKIAGYEKNLLELKSKLSEVKVNADGFRQQTQALGPKKIASLQITTATTIAQVLTVANIGLVRELDAIKNQANSKRMAVMLKAYGNEIKGIRAWVQEADSMEAESED